MIADNDMDPSNKLSDIIKDSAIGISEQESSVAIVTKSEDQSIISLPSLNTRFRDYLSKVKTINQHNNVLSAELAKKYDHFTTQLSESSSNLHKELYLQRHVYTCNYGQYLSHNARYKRYSSKCQQYIQKITMLKDELNQINEHKNDLTERNKVNKSELSSLTAKVDEVQRKNSELKAEISRLEEEEDQLDCTLKNEEVSRIQCQLDIEFIKTEMLFTRIVYDEIVSILKKSTQSAFKDAQFYDVELNNAKLEIRSEFAKRAERSIEELTKDYKNQFENIKESFKSTNDEIECRSQDLATTTSITSILPRKSSFQNELVELQQVQGSLSEARLQNSKLCNQLSSLEDELEQVILSNREAREERANLLSSTRTRIMEMLMKVQSAKAVKYSLQSEIDTYRQILCDEEVRIAVFSSKATPDVTVGESGNEEKFTNKRKLETTVESDRKAAGSSVVTRSHSHYMQIVTEGIISSKSSDIQVIDDDHDNATSISGKASIKNINLEKRSSTQKRGSSVNSEQITTDSSNALEQAIDHTSIESNKPESISAVDTTTSLISSIAFNENKTTQILCRCGKNELISPDQLILNSGGVYVRCVDCSEWSHARCYNVGDMKDRKRKNFYCSNCYKAIKRHRY
ncbi:hypothetical protein GJ496_010527 [Pomphorhynchus laevis]|nr:hypothetical protein GJ496_010527 [Pomphorhynchus laevis]